MSDRPAISIVIPTLNEQDNLPKCLGSIASQDYPRELLEVIVVDNDSTDATCNIAEKAGARVLHNAAKDPERSKMTGLREARSELFIYLDADIELAEPDVLSRLVEPLREDPSIAGAFPRFDARRNAPAIERFLHYHPLELDPVLDFLCASIRSVATAGKQRWRVCDFSAVRVPPVGICLYRRDILLRALKGRERFMDVDVPILVARSGYASFAYVPEARIYHSNIRTLGDLLRKRLRNLHEVFLPSHESREFRYLPSGPRGLFKAALLVALANTPFYFMIRGLAKAVKHRDVACLYEPVAACALADALIIGMLRDKKGRRFVKSVFCGKEQRVSGEDKGNVAIINRGHLGPDEMSGGEVIAVSLCRYWAEEGLHVKQVCTAHTPAIWSGLCSESVEYAAGDAGRRPLLTYLKRSLDGLRLKLPGEPAVIYSASDFIYDVLPAYRLKRKCPQARWYAGLYLLVRMPGVRDLLRSPRTALRRTLTFLGQRLSLRFIRAAADCVFVLNEADARTLRGAVEERTAVRVFPVGVDAREIASIAPGETTCEAIYLGAIHPRKGIEDLLRAWSLVVGKRPGAKLFLVGHGEGRYVESMRSLAKSLYVEKNVSFQGPRKGREKYAVLKAVRIMVHPSREESFALAILEGMACGLPVVAYDLDAYRGIYDAGMSVAGVGDHVMLAEKILALLEDDDHRTALAREARNLAEGRDRQALIKDFMSSNDIK